MLVRLPSEGEELVACRMRIDMAEVGRWARNEGQDERLRRFQDLLRG